MRRSDGRLGSMQRMFDAGPAFTHVSTLSGALVFRAHSLTAEDLLDVQRHHVLDWLISNFDAHAENFIRLRSTGRIVGVDKGKAFRMFGRDRLHYRFGPTIYNALWHEFTLGRARLLDPRRGELAEYVATVQAVDDDALRDALRPYVEAAGAARVLSIPDPELFVTAVLERKRTLRLDFARLYELAVDARVGLAPPPVSHDSLNSGTY